jgi:hypothetical protein
LDADITISGITFEVEIGAPLTKLQVSAALLYDFHNPAATFQDGIDDTINLPPIAGCNMGSICLQIIASIHMSLTESTSDIILKSGGRFGNFTLDAQLHHLNGLPTL